MPPRGPRKSTPAGQAGDDFQQIQGIGAAIDRRLHDAGILTYQDLAALTPEQIAASLAGVAGLSPARIASQDWAGQAGPARRARRSTLPSEPDQRYASFHVEFLLDVDDSVRRTKVHHHQSGTDEAWAGWDEDRLLALLRDHIPNMSSQLPAEAADVPSSAAPAAAEPETAAPPGAQLDRVTASGDQPDGAVPSGDQPAEAIPLGGQAETTDLPVGLPSSSLRVDYLGLTREGQRSRNWVPDEPTSIGFTLRVSRTITREAAAVDFSADITASSVLGDDQRWPLGTVREPSGSTNHCRSS